MRRSHLTCMYSEHLVDGKQASLVENRDSQEHTCRTVGHRQADQIRFSGHVLTRRVEPPEMDPATEAVRCTPGGYAAVMIARA